MNEENLPISESPDVKAPAMSSTRTVIQKMYDGIEVEVSDRSSEHRRKEVLEPVTYDT
jgi:hypothetical protein